MTLQSNPAAGFIAIGRHVLLRPGQPNRNAIPETPTTKGPTLILLFGWMSAPLSHLHMYTHYYTQVYPHATQILIRSHPSFFLSTRSLDAALAPVLQELEDMGCIPRTNHRDPEIDAPEPHRILIHVFSNGGGLVLATLSRLLPHRPAQATLTSIIVLDSLPGSTWLSSLVIPTTTRIRTPPHPLHPLALFTLLLLHAYHTLLYILLGTPRPIDILRRTLLAPRVLPWVDARTPRVYVFSTGDAVVPWPQVRAHVREAQACGLGAREVLFEGTHHMGHARADPGKYWASIGEAWGDEWRARVGEGNGPSRSLKGSFGHL